MITAEPEPESAPEGALGAQPGGAPAPGARRHARSSRRRAGSTRCRCATSPPRPTSRSAPSTATSRRRSGCCSRRWRSSKPTCARTSRCTRRASDTPADAGRVGAAAARTGRCASYPDVTAAMVRSFGTAQIENADIVQRVTEIMTGIITNAIHAPERRVATEREVRVARILMQVWLSSLNGWVCGVDGPDRVDEDLAAAAPSCCSPEAIGSARASAALASRVERVLFSTRMPHPPLQLRRPVRAGRRQGPRPSRARRRPARGDVPRSSTSGPPASPTPWRTSA